MMCSQESLKDFSTIAYCPSSLMFFQYNGSFESKRLFLSAMALLIYVGLPPLVLSIATLCRLRIDLHLESNYGVTGLKLKRTDRSGIGALMVVQRVDSQRSLNSAEEVLVSAVFSGAQ